MVRLSARLIRVLGFALVVLAPASALAQITILSAQPDLTTGTLAVTGTPFAVGVRMFIAVAGITEMPVMSQTPTQVKATLPAVVAPGSYLLLAYQPQTAQFGTFNVTIAAPKPVLSDHNGNVIGPLLTVSTVLVKFGNDMFTAYATTDGFSADGGVVFLESDCSGPGYVADSLAHSLPTRGLNEGVGSLKNIYWVPDTTVAPFAPHTNLFYPDSTGAVCQPLGDSGAGVYQKMRALDLNGFTPPFSVRVQ